MRRVSLIMIIAGILLVAGGFVFLHRADNAADSKPMVATTGGNETFRWPVSVGAITLFLGGIFFLASTRRNGKVQH